MTTFTIPKDSKPWPSLGGQVCDFIESYLVHGPGDLLGEPVILDQEKRALIWRMYEVYPKGHDMAGRRRFKRCAISMRKGTAKTELAALITAAELHPAGPVRCDGFDSRGDPVGRPVVDPYIPMVAYTEEQSDELAYGALKAILERSELVGDFDIGLERIMRIGGDGKAVSLATSPNARDGARTTYQVFDETHALSLPNLKRAHKTMLANIPKRYLADAWSLEITTAPAPGENSIAEDTMEYARQVDQGLVEDSKLFFFHREASEAHDLETPDGLRAAVVEASGPAADWSDIESICQQWADPTADKSLLQRLWLNQVVRGSNRAFDVEKWKTLADSDYQPQPGAKIVLGFDGARWVDSTALVATEIVTGFQWLAGLWEHPQNIDDWEVPLADVLAVVDQAFQIYDVWRMYCDPPYWESTVAGWAGQYGEQKVLEWWTNRNKAMAYAIKSYDNAIKAGDILHDGNPHLTRHLGNAVKNELRLRDENGQRLWTIYKERPDSPFKIDAAMAAVLSWQARQDAITAGQGTKPPSIYEKRGLMTV